MSRQVPREVEPHFMPDGKATQRADVILALLRCCDHYDAFVQWRRELCQTPDVNRYRDPCDGNCLTVWPHGNKMIPRERDLVEVVW